MASGCGNLIATARKVEEASAVEDAIREEPLVASFATHLTYLRDCGESNRRDKVLPQVEQSQVVQFAIDLARSRQLSGDELAGLAQRMIETSDPAEKERLKAELTRGFYGD